MEENNADFVIYIVTTKDYDSVEEPLKQLMEKYPDLTGVVEYWDNVSNETLGEFKEMAKDATTLTGQMQFLLKTDGTCIEFQFERERYEKEYFTIGNSTAIDRFSRVQYDKKQI